MSYACQVSVTRRGHARFALAVLTALSACAPAPSFVTKDRHLPSPALCDRVEPPEGTRESCLACFASGGVPRWSSGNIELPSSWSCQSFFHHGDPCALVSVPEKQALCVDCVGRGWYYRSNETMCEIPRR